MTPSATTVTPAVSEEALGELVATVADDFPAVGMQAGPADVQTTLDELLPAPEALVLVVPAASGPARDLFVVVSAALLSTMGGSSADDLPSLVERTLVELGDGDAPDLAAARLGVGAEALAGLPVAGSAPGATMVAAGVFAGVDHVGTVGVAVHGTASPAPVASDEPASLDLPQVATTPPAPVASAATTAGGRGLDLLGGVEMSVVAELGRTRMTVADLLSLTPGSVVELDRAAGSPIDLLVNGTLIARGEVVVVDEEFGLRISEIVDGTDGR